MIDHLEQLPDKEVKRRFQLWLKPSVLDMADDLYAKNNCGSRSEFIEKAIQFYAGYLYAQLDGDPPDPAQPLSYAHASVLLGYSGAGRISSPAVPLSQDYFPRVITSTLKGIMADSTNKISCILFKLAVEQAITMNVVAATCNISREQLEKLRGTCVAQVKRTNGSYAFEDAFDFQKR